MKQSYFCQKAQNSSNAADLNSGANQGFSEIHSQGVDQLVNSANCHYRVGTCYRIGSDFEGKPVLDDVYSKCLSVDKTSTSATTDAQMERGRDLVAAQDYIIEILSQVLMPEDKCWKNAGTQYEAQARQAMADGFKGKTAEAVKMEAINCITHDNSNRVCQYTGTRGQRFSETDYEDPLRDKEGSSPARMGKDHCSGTLLGDGVTIVTAGHCTIDNAGTNEFTVHDRNGVAHYVDAHCVPGNFEFFKVDISKCTTSKAIDANPVYLATLDSNVAGNNCVDENFVMRCGPGFFEDLSTREATIWVYPSGYNLTRTTGTMYYDSAKNILNYDAICTGGCSGGGVLVDHNGRKVVVAANSWGNRYLADQSGANPALYSDWNSLKLQSVQTEKLENATLFFSEMPIQ